MATKIIQEIPSTIDELVAQLSATGVAQLGNLGLFKVNEVRGRKLYNFAKGRTVALKPYYQITFKPSERTLRTISTLRKAKKANL